MLIGYNTNVKYKGKTYHIQTEDCGPSNPQIVTLLYYQGAILSSKKTNYSYILGQPGFEEKLRDLMKQQHREMIMELKRIAGEPDPGEIDVINHSRPIDESKNQIETQMPKGSGDSEARKSLDDILIDFITRRGRR